MKNIDQKVTQAHTKHKMLFILSCFCLILLSLRAGLTHSTFFFFLAWNLFLAYLPLSVTSLLMSTRSLRDKKLYFYPLFVCWLLVLPNAPYIITDFVHLQRELDVPVWFDVLLLISFTVNGLLFGLASMQQMFNILVQKLSRGRAKAIMAVVCILSAYGIYLGRYLRYNSWDILHKPMDIAADIINSFIDPSCYKASLGITLGFGTLLYLLFSLYNDDDKQNNLYKS